MHVAALPRRLSEGCLNGLPQTLVAIAHDQLNTAQAPFLEPYEEIEPTGATLAIRELYARLSTKRMKSEPPSSKLASLNEGHQTQEAPTMAEVSTLMALFASFNVTMTARTAESMGVLLRGAILAVGPRTATGCVAAAWP